MVDIWSAPITKKPIDPHEKAREVLIDLSTVLEDGEEINPLDWEITVEAASVTLGVEIRADGSYAPATVAGNRSVTFIPKISDAEEDDERWNPPGKVATFKFHGTTDNAPPRDIDRTFQVRFCNQ